MQGKRSLTAFLLISIIFLSIPTLAVGDESHVRPGDGEEHLDPLIDTLDRTKNDIEDSLNEALSVDYTLKENNGSILRDQNPEGLNRSEEIAISLKRELSTVDEVLWDIEGEIESSAPLKEHFVPFYRLSSNLTDYTRYHRNLTNNLTLMVDAINERNVTIRSDIDLGEAFNNAYFYLEEMRSRLDSMGKNLENVNQNLFDLENLNEIIQGNYALLEDYEGYLEMIDRYLDRDPALTLYGPKEGYPGSEIILKGVFNEKGAAASDIEISLFKENETIAELPVPENGFFEYGYNVSWDQELLSVNFSAEVKSKNISSGNLTIDIVKYPSDIHLRTEKDAYYDETVYIEGLFKTEAPVNLTTIELNSTEKGSFEIARNGTFRFGFDSIDFRWGETKTKVNYSGNKTISRSQENISFEVSIPTKIVFSESTKILGEFEPGELDFKGRLVNVSSFEGLEDQTLALYLNGEHVTNITTDEEGKFIFTLPDNVELEEGDHILNARYEGPARFRNSTSKDIQIKVESERKFWQRPIVMIIGAGIIGISTVGYYLFESRKKGERYGEEGTVKPSDRRKPSKVSVSKANSGDDVTKAYREFLDELESSGVVEVQSSKTHREIEYEITSRPKFDKLADEVKFITDIFEKALFTDKNVKKSEIEKFNTSLSRLAKEGLS